MDDDYRIRSYHRAFTPDLKMYGIGDWKWPRPVPARFVLYAMALEAISFVAAHFVVLRNAYGTLPLGVRIVAPAILAWLLAAAKVQGRWFHSELLARTRSWGMPRWIAGCYWPTDGPGETLELGKIAMRGSDD